MNYQSKKIVLLGHRGVGKTSLVRRFIHQSFSEDYISTIGVTIEKKVIQLEDEEVALIIWDVEGHALVEDVPPSYLMGVQGLIYVFDLSDPITWSNIENQIKFIRDNFPFIPLKIIGNKEDKISDERLSEIHKELNLFEFISGSAKTGDKVEELFTAMASLFAHH